MYLLKAAHLVSKPRLKAAFEPKASVRSLYQLIASSWVSCTHKLDKFNDLY